MGILGEIIKEYKIDRVPIKSIQKVSMYLGYVLVLFLGLKWIGMQTSLFLKLLIVLLCLVVGIWGRFYLQYILTFFIGVPLTIISKSLKVDTQSDKFIDYAINRLNYLKSENIINNRQYTETVNLIIGI